MLAEATPYVGPRPFERKDHDFFFGREREARDLLGLVVANAAVLVYSTSGAGKTSLLQARLVPMLEDKGFEVMHRARVGGLPNSSLFQDSNPYILNALVSLEGESAEAVHSAAQGKTLRQYFEGRTKLCEPAGFPRPRAVLFDQFEEIFTSYPGRWQERPDFFAQVAEALEADPLLRVVLILREEFVAKLDTYATLFPHGLQVRLYLERLRETAALEAVRGPLEATGRHFAPRVAEELVENLMRMCVEAENEGTVEVQGEFVEPVQLQVVCQRLWEGLPRNAVKVTRKHLHDLGDVDQALATFYEATVRQAVAASEVREMDLRSWFSDVLVTPAGTRGIVYRGQKDTTGLSNEVVDLLEGLHILRGEWRAGARWYELAHDRLIKPIQEANRKWREDETAQRYFAFLVDRYSTLSFQGLGVASGALPRLPLLDLYVPLEARMEQPEGETWNCAPRLGDGDDGMEGASEMLSPSTRGGKVLSILQKSDGLVVLGDPGAGKTTFLKYLTLMLSKGRGTELGLGDRLPVLLPLAAYATSVVEERVAMDRFIAKIYPRELGISGPIDALIERGLREGRVLLLLDGLDEVQDEMLRRDVAQAVEDFYSHYHQLGNKLVVTSRLVRYREVRPTAGSLRECVLVDWQRPDIHEFVRRLGQALERASLSRIGERGLEQMLTRLDHYANLLSLSANPLWLTFLVVMHLQGAAFPEQRVALYRHCVKALLHHWNLARGLYGRAGRGLDVPAALKILAPLALCIHETSPGVGLLEARYLRRELIRIFTETGSEDPEEAARRFFDEVHQETSLLLARGVGQYGFLRLAFQEYLAALELVHKGGATVTRAFAKHVGQAGWEEVLLLAVGHLSLIEGEDEAASAVLQKVLDESERESAGATEVLVGRALIDLGTRGVTAKCRSKGVEALVRALKDQPRVDARRRAAAGDLLAKLGDPRERIMKVEGMEFVEVPGGAFWMGSPVEEREAEEEERPRHRCTIPYTYRIARYPITNAQYREYIEHNRNAAGDFVDLQGPANHPVTQVTWSDAVAFCQWLSRKWQERLRGWVVRLPSEAEWEKAARGVGGRKYPWGDSFAAETNCLETGIGKTSTVGCFPGSKSPFGCEDICGNVREWTRSLWRNSGSQVCYGYPYQAQDGREDSSAPGECLRVLRGGSYQTDFRRVRCAARDRVRPDHRGADIGFRVILAPEGPKL